MILEALTDAIIHAQAKLRGANLVAEIRIDLPPKQFNLLLREIQNGMSTYTAFDPTKPIRLFDATITGQFE